MARKRKTKIMLIGYRFIPKPISECIEVNKTLSITSNTDLITKGEFFEALKKANKWS